MGGRRELLGCVHPMFACGVQSVVGVDRVDLSRL